MASIDKNHDFSLWNRPLRHRDPTAPPGHHPPSANHSMIRFCSLLFRFSLFLFGGILIIFLLLPVILTTAASPLLERNHIHDLDITIDRLTPWLLTGNLTAGGRQQPGLGASFQLHFSPADLLAGKINTLQLQGVTIYMALVDGKPVLHGFSIPGQDPAEQPSPPAFASLPAMIEHIIVREAQLLVDPGDEQRLVFLFSGECDLAWKKDSDGYGVTAITAFINGEGELPFSARAQLTRRQDHFQADIDATIRDLAASFGSPRNQVALSGSATLRGKADLSPGLDELLNVKADIGSTGLRLAAGNAALTASEDAPLAFSLAGDSKELTINVSGLQLTHPFPATARLSALLQPGNRKASATLHVASDLLAEPATISMAGRLGPEAPSLEVVLHGPSQQILTEPPLILGAHRLQAHLLDDEHGMTVMIEGDIARLTLPEHTMELEQLKIGLPLPLTAPFGTSPPGKLSVEHIRFQGESLASLAAAITPQAGAIQLSGEVKSRRNGGLRLRFAGSASQENLLALDFTVPPVRLTEKTLPRRVKLPKGLTLNGRLQGKGNINMTASGPTGSVTLSLADASLDLAEQNVHLQGIESTLTLPALPGLLSLPSQELRISSLALGNLRFTDGRIRYRVEDSLALFIEKSRFTWCGGKVESGSLRISPDKPELATTLYCDRLQFTELLGQLGISDAEGKGSLNGRLPILFDGRRLSFEDGFLFSTPGDGGIVRFGNTELLQQGLPPGGQAAHLDYSIQAMENFAYNWTKLTFASDGDDLRITMQIDGKPATPLPFGYSSGQLVKVTAGSGIQHPIRLDVNFHLPFAQMFKYGQSIQQMMNK